MVDINQTLFTAVSKLLRPLVRILLRNGIPYAAFRDLAKEAYVDIALNEFGMQGKKQTDSRVATITGLTRKEVKRLKEIKREDDKNLVDRYNRAAKVIWGWVHDSEYAVAPEEKARLPIEGERISFSALVKTYSGDIPYRAILDELIQVGIVREIEKGTVELLTRAYIPNTKGAESLRFLGDDVSGLISTIDNNTKNNPQKTLFQRKVYYDNLPQEATAQLHELLCDRGQSLLEFLDKWMAEHDRDSNPHVEGTGRKAAGVGLYYFENDIDTRV